MSIVRPRSQVVDLNFEQTRFYGLPHDAEFKRPTEEFREDRDYVKNKRRFNSSKPSGNANTRGVRRATRR